MKAVDKASPIIVQTATQCTSPGSAYFVARKASEYTKTGDGVEYLKITMKEVFFTSVSPNSGTDLPLETVTLGFKSAEVKVAAQKADGTLDAYVTGVVDANSCGDKGEH
ncbi:MAG TPA: type VI secretion system tube protein Hcp [Anaeromyxobacter sp.]